MKQKDFLTKHLIAHRGLHDKYLENTISSFKEAIINNYIIELDARLTKDNEVIVFHDYNIKRIFHIDRDINDLNLNEIKKYKYIPTLSEVLDLVKGRVPLIIEIKSDKRSSYLERKVSNLLDNYKGEFAIQSFNPLSILWFKLNKKNYIVGYLIYSIPKTRNYLNNILIKLLKPDYIGINLKSLKNDSIKQLRTKYLIIGYTANNNKEYLEYKKYADNLIVDIKKQETVPLRTVSQKE